jgi:hypothetical protein
MEINRKLSRRNAVNKITKRIQDNQIRLDLIKTIAPVIAYYDGKKITKRIATKLEKKLNKFTVYFSKDYGTYKLIIWGNGIDYNNRFTALIGYHSNNTVNYDSFIKYNQCHFLNKGRNKLMKKGLQDIDSLVDNYNSLYENKMILEDKLKSFEMQYLFD